MDADNTKWITLAEFDIAVKRLNFNRPTALLFSQLDKDGNKKLEVDDMKFLDKWKPLEFLTVTANYEAMEEVRQKLLRHSGKYIKAWRNLLDKDATNRCNWYEFQEACEAVGYKGDIAGAWRAFDEDLSGYISLREVDEESSQILLGFRKWANDSFGGVKSLFNVFDTDASGSLSFQEFRAACRIYGYEGSTKILFAALDCDHGINRGKGELSWKELDFLDDWDLQNEEDVAEEKHDQKEKEAGPSGPSSAAKTQKEKMLAMARELGIKPAVMTARGWSRGDDPMRIIRVTRLNRGLSARAQMGTPSRSTQQRPHTSDAVPTLASSVRGSHIQRPKTVPTVPNVFADYGQDWLKPVHKDSVLHMGASTLESFTASAEVADQADSRRAYGNWLVEKVGASSTWAAMRERDEALDPSLSLKSKMTSAQVQQGSGKPTLDLLLRSPRVGPSSLSPASARSARSRRRAAAYDGHAPLKSKFSM